MVLSSLSLARDEDSLVFQTGQDVMMNNGVVLFGMSPGNPYFKSRVIEDYVDYLGKEKRRIIVVVPQQPAEHTYRALGSKDAVKRAKKNSSQLKSHCRRAIERVSKVWCLISLRKKKKNKKLESSDRLFRSFGNMTFTRKGASRKLGARGARRFIFLARFLFACATH